MKKLLLIVLILFACEGSPNKSSFKCGNGASFSEFGYSCEDLSVVQDIIDINSSLEGMDVSEIVYSNHFNIYGRLIVLHLAGREIEYLPESIGGLSALIDLDLEDNQLKTLPSGIVSLSNLKMSLVPT